MDVDENDVFSDVFAAPRREDSDSSWHPSSEDQDQDQVDIKISKDTLFLVSLGALMALFTYVYLQFSYFLPIELLPAPLKPLTWAASRGLPGSTEAAASSPPPPNFFVHFLCLTMKAC
jgi:hypothetical protein